VVKLLASSIYGFELLLLKLIIVLFIRSRCLPCSIVYKSESDYVIRPPPPIPLAFIIFLEGR
jgi:hypothetical protein